MSQNSLVVADGTGAQVLAAINNGLDTLKTLHSGPTSPASPSPYQLWVDTTTNLLKLRDSANAAWITVGDTTKTKLGLAGAQTFAGSFTRDVSLASGAQSITGLGFVPRKITFYAAMASAPANVCSSGVATASGAACLVDYNGVIASSWTVGASAVFLQFSGGGVSYSGTVTMNAPDGFTVNWTKAGAPTGIAYIYYVAEE